MKDNKHDLPFQEPTFYILLSLRGSEKHGYAMLKDVSQLSGGRVKLSTGTLYGALYRLLDQGYIEQVEMENGVRRKKAYRLTPAGLSVFSAEVDRIKHILHAVKEQSLSQRGQQI